MEKQIRENGIDYILGKDGFYYPDLKVMEDRGYRIGKFGRLRMQYLKEYRKAEYCRRVLSGELYEHLQCVDAECNEKVELIISQMKVKEGITEELKEADQMQWVRMMNSIKKTAIEIVLDEVVYG